VRFSICWPFRDNQTRRSVLARIQPVFFWLRSRGVSAFWKCHVYARHQTENETNEQKKTTTRPRPDSRINKKTETILGWYGFVFFNLKKKKKKRTYDDGILRRVLTVIFFSHENQKFFTQLILRIKINSNRTIVVITPEFATREFK